MIQGKISCLGFFFPYSVMFAISVYLFYHAAFTYGDNLMVFQIFVCNEKKYSHRGIENLIPSKITLQSVDLQFSITRI